MAVSGHVPSVLASQLTESGDVNLKTNLTVCITLIIELINNNENVIRNNNRNILLIKEMPTGVILPFFVLFY